MGQAALPSRRGDAGAGDRRHPKYHRASLEFPEKAGFRQEPVSQVVPRSAAYSGVTQTAHGGREIPPAPVTRNSSGGFRTMESTRLKRAIAIAAFGGTTLVLGGAVAHVVDAQQTPAASPTP